MQITVLITSYNQRSYLEAAIESVLAQTRRPDEILILDDCSTDGSQQMISSYARRYPEIVHPIIQSTNLGISRNRNVGYFSAKGDVVVYLDGDDTFLPTKLETDLDTLERNPMSQMAYSNFRIVSDAGLPIHTWTDEPEELPVGDVLLEVFSRSFPRSSLFRNELVYTECVRSVGGMDSSLAMYEDWDLKIRLSSRCRMSACGRITSEYRSHATGVSRSAPEHHLRAMKYVVGKNRSLLNRLDEDKKRFVMRCLAEQHLAPLSFRCMKRSFGSHHIAEVARYYLSVQRYDWHGDYGQAANRLLADAIKSRLRMLAAR